MEDFSNFVLHSAEWPNFIFLFSRFLLSFICLLFPIFYFNVFFSFLYYRAENPNWHTELDGRWFTSRVISRIKSNLVQTKGGPYCLEGKMNFQLAFSYGTPQFILSAFKSGFPENWETYREEWRKFIKQRSMNDHYITWNCPKFLQVGDYQKKEAIIYMQAKTDMLL